MRGPPTRTRAGQGASAAVSALGFTSIPGLSPRPFPALRAQKPSAQRPSPALSSSPEVTAVIDSSTGNTELLTMAIENKQCFIVNKGFFMRINSTWYFSRFFFTQWNVN